MTPGATRIKNAPPTTIFSPNCPTVSAIKSGSLAPKSSPFSEIRSYGRFHWKKTIINPPSKIFKISYFRWDLLVLQSIILSSVGENASRNLRYGRSKRFVASYEIGLTIDLKNRKCRSVKKLKILKIHTSTMVANPFDIIMPNNPWVALTPLRFAILSHPSFRAVVWSHCSAWNEKVKS